MTKKVSSSTSNQKSEFKTQAEITEFNSHYKQSRIEFVFVVEDWNLSYNLGSVLKYINRAGKKKNEPKSVALSKALFYLTRERNLAKEKENEDAKNS